MIFDQRQTSNATGPNRHPRDFAAAKTFLLNEFPDDTEPKVLSFGCSTGEELLSLRDLVVSDRERSGIVGVEIMPDVRLKAIQNCKHCPNISVLSNEQFLVDKSKYAVIFCMAVFCIYPLTDKLRSMPDTFTFQDFENDVIRLTEKLVPGGLLFIKDANYIFEHTAVYAKRFRIYDPELRDQWMVPKFDVTGHRIEAKFPVYRSFKMTD